MDYGHNGKSFAEVWVTCHSPSDCMQIIEWLRLCKENMHEWEKISAKAARSENAKLPKE